ncbi:KAP family P-loop NTPase fold protein [Piscinibacter koreensis]|uniref:KAP NTPase domain-containing protein n=1 Tax=Piscinibacter koreensis TaxID=2742824 RepID=A0A7Y6NJP7_9BURK|nr:P-loop NTPase fold protein [Schlegelella koreensis]NUZ04392.1 hypothetical protein [Schlegelella koreensis]
MTHPLSFRPPTINPEQPFEGDGLSRSTLAKPLTSFVNRLRNGGTIGIDAAWGEGKTWFGARWAAQLRQEGHKVAYIDAFENDFAEDPFLLVMSSLLPLIENPDVKATLAKRAGGALRAFAPAGVKTLINLGGKILRQNDIVGDFADAVAEVSQDMAEGSSKWIEKRLTAFDEEKKSVIRFRETLAEAIAACAEPAVVFIDELDRCRPSFAVTMVERVKHLFDVPNLVFVLLLNRTQLEQSIQGVYGAIDGSAYLGKFVNIWFRLPTLSTFGTQTRGAFTKQMTATMIERLTGTVAYPDFLETIQYWVPILGMSLRDLERACVLQLAAGDEQGVLLSYLIATKVKQPADFAALRRGDQTLHINRAIWLEQLFSDRNQHPGRMCWALGSVHRAVAGNTIADEQRKSEVAAMLNGRDPVSTFWRLSDKIDLPLAR